MGIWVWESLTDFPGDTASEGLGWEITAFPSSPPAWASIPG